MDHIIHEIKGVELRLLREKALIWDEKKLLILADLHLGKVTHFRKEGIPLPKEVEKDNYDRFSYLLLNNDLERVIILGDLFHSEYNTEWQQFMDFLRTFSHISFDLVLGNHDILSTDQYTADNLIIHETLTIPPFFMTHEPQKQENLVNMCGHIHPSIIMKGKGLQRLRLPCFYLNHDGLILPAFGAFTGTHSISPSEEDNIFVISKEAIIKVL
jgi:DNA ligase-associated metallophosphoesterase